MARDAGAAKVRKKAESGDAEAMYELVTEWMTNDDPEGLVWLERAAAAGVGEALSSLGWSHERGLRGTPVNLAKAIEHYERAVAAGETEMGPLKLAAHVKKLAAKLKRQGTAGVDPMAALVAEVKLDKHKDAILGARRPSIRWVATPLAKDDGPLGGSKLGGSPDLPVGATWPRGAGRALEHVATIDFDQAPAIEGAPVITGKLLFFYDAKNMAFGDDTEGDGAWAIVPVARGVDVVRTKAPAGTKTLKASRLAPAIETTLPAVCAHAYASLGLPAKAIDKYRDLLEALPRADRSIEYHRSFGHGDVTDESENPEPLLLLQVDSYDHGEINWGDAGRLFWWIDPADAAAGRHDRARFQLQA